MTDRIADGGRMSIETRRGAFRGVNGDGRRTGARGVTLRSAMLAAIALLIVSLCYKLSALGVLVMLALGLAAWTCRRSFRRVDAVFVLAMAYVADATISTLMVSVHAGIARTVQFGIIAVSLLGLYAYAQAAQRRDAEMILKGAGVVCAAVLAHLIGWHLLHHHFVTWKYLSDTKLILSLALVPLFGLEDWIKGKGQHLFTAALLVAFVVLLLSGERKALMLFVVLFALCRYPVAAKLGLAGLIALVTGLVLLDDTGYVHRQLFSASHDYSHTPMRYFFSVQAIYDQSDIIREFVNRNAWQLFLRHPALGVGANGYWVWAAKTYGANGLAMNVHGEYHRVPAEGGVLGIAIAVGFLGLAGWRALRHAGANGGWRAASLDRVPLYCVALLLSYCYSEAVDTAMLLLIGGVGAIVGALPIASRDGRVGRQRFGRLSGGFVRPTRMQPRAPALAGSLRRRA